LLNVAIFAVVNFNYLIVTRCYRVYACEGVYISHYPSPVFGFLTKTHLDCFGFI